VQRCGGLESVKLRRTGKVFTFVVDHVADSPDSPVVSTVIDLDGGGRVLMELTTARRTRWRSNMPVELTFRRYHDGFGMKNYFWKARPRTSGSWSIVPRRKGNEWTLGLAKIRRCCASRRRTSSPRNVDDARPARMMDDESGHSPELWRRWPSSAGRV